MTIRVPGVTRAYGQTTVLQYRGQALVAAAGAAVTPYLAGTATPYPGPLYATAEATEPLTFPVATGADGVVALWGDAPARLDVVASAPGLGQAVVTLDLELPPDAPGLDAYTKTQSDARYPQKTDADPYPQYLTPTRGDLRYLPLGYVPPAVDVTVGVDASLTAVESPANTFALAARLSPDAANALALRGNGLYVPTAAVVTSGEYTFSANATMADPGSGNFRSNTGSSATATALALDQLGAGGTDVSTLFSALRLGDTVYVQDKNDSTRWARYQMTGAPTLNSGWAHLPVVVINAGAAIGGGQLCVMQMTMTAGGGGGGIGLATDALADAKGDLFAASANNAIDRLAVGANGQVLTADSAQSLGVTWAAFPVALTDAWVSFVIDGGGAAVTTGQKGHFVVPAGTILEARLLADQTGSVVVDLWKDTYVNAPPTAADSICPTAKPTLSSALKSQNTSLTGWATTLADGDILAVNVDSVSVCQRVSVVLKVRKS